MGHIQKYTHTIIHIYLLIIDIKNTCSNSMPLFLTPVPRKQQCTFIHGGQIFSKEVQISCMSVEQVHVQQQVSLVFSNITLNFFIFSFIFI